MSNPKDNNETGIVYHIDLELMRKAREKQLQKSISKIDMQIENAERDLLVFKAAETALVKVESLLRQMRSLAVEASSNPKANKKLLNKQLDSYKKQVGEIVESATCDGINLLDGSMGSINNVIAAVNAILNENERR